MLSQTFFYSHNTMNGSRKKQSRKKPTSVEMEYYHPYRWIVTDRVEDPRMLSDNEDSHSEEPNDRAFLHRISHLFSSSVDTSLQRDELSAGTHESSKGESGHFIAGATHEVCDSSKQMKNCKRKALDSKSNKATSETDKACIPAKKSRPGNAPSA